MKTWPTYACGLHKTIAECGAWAKEPVTVEGVTLAPGERCGFVWIFRTWRLAIPPTRDSIEGPPEEEIERAVRYVCDVED